MNYYYSFKDINLKIKIDLINNDYKISKINFINHIEKNKWEANIKPIPLIEEIENFFYNYFVKKIHLPFQNLHYKGTLLQLKIWEKLSSIPFGEVITYKDLALMSGLNKNYSRVTGNACRLNPIPIIIPCHRVIAKNNSLGGYSGGLHIKKRLLEHENSLYKTRIKTNNS